VTSQPVKETFYRRVQEATQALGLGKIWYREGGDSPEILPFSEDPAVPASFDAPFSYTHRPPRGSTSATGRSWSIFYFPQNSFVWENKRIDSRPYKSNTKTPDFLATRAQSMQLGETNRMVALIVVCDAAESRYSGLKLPARGGTSSY
jgi:hypothetical protein